MQWAPGRGSYLSPDGNYLVWAQLAWVAWGASVPILGNEPKKWEILSLSKSGMPGRSIPKGQSVPLA